MAKVRKKKDVTSQPKLNVTYMSVDDLDPYENNPRKNDNAVEDVKKSLAEFGWQQPIVVDKNHVLIVGHTRLRAAIELGMTEVPVVVADNLTEEQVTAYRIADNRTGENAEWDFDKLAEEVASLAEADYDVSLTGFDESELDKLIVDLDAEDVEEEPPEDFDEHDEDNIETDYECPKCGYRWSGKKA